MCLAAQACSAISLTGLVQHMAEVERNWFRRVLEFGRRSGPLPVAVAEKT